MYAYACVRVRVHMRVRSPGCVIEFLLRGRRVLLDAGARLIVGFQPTTRALNGHSW